MDVLPGEAAIDWEPLIVSLAVIATLCLIVVVAILKYSAGQAWKMMDKTGGLLGVLLGSIGAYYFQGKVAQYDRQEDLRTVQYTKEDYHDVLEDYDELEKDLAEFGKRVMEDYNDLFEDYQDLEKERDSLREQLNQVNSTP